MATRSSPAPTSLAGPDPLIRGQRTAEQPLSDKGSSAVLAARLASSATVTNTYQLFVGRYAN